VFKTVLRSDIIRTVYPTDNSGTQMNCTLKKKMWNFN